MPFDKINVKNEIEKQKQDDPEFRNKQHVILWIERKEHLCLLTKP